MSDGVPVLNINDVKPVAVEHWLKNLAKQTPDSKERLARGSRMKIRNAMSAVYNHAIRWEFTDRNPITGPVKGSGLNRTREWRETYQSASLWYLYFRVAAWFSAVHGSSDALDVQM